MDPIVIECSDSDLRNIEQHQKRVSNLEMDGSLRPLLVKIKGKVSSVGASYVVRLMQIARRSDRVVSISVDNEKAYEVLKVLKVTQWVPVTIG